MATTSNMVAPANLGPMFFVKLARSPIQSVADFTGKPAKHYAALHRLTQRLCMETATAKGWTVPFRQVVVHHADSIEAAAAAEEEK